MNNTEKNKREESLGATVAIAYNLMRNRQTRAITSKGFEITLEQLAILEQLYSHGEMNMTALAHGTWKQNANITRIVDKLYNRKLVARKSVKGDRRAHLISITNQGVSVFENVIPIVIETNKEMFSCITAKEESITVSSLKKIIVHLADK